MLRVKLVCRSCGYSKDLEGSGDDEVLPERCPSCGSRDLVFEVYRYAPPHEMDGERGKVKPLLEDAFMRQVSLGEWEADLTRTMTDDVAIAEVEPGEYEILFKLRRVG